jgi:hypothetical protein
MTSGVTNVGLFFAVWGALFDMGLVSLGFFETSMFYTKYHKRQVLAI